MPFTHTLCTALLLLLYCTKEDGVNSGNVYIASRMQEKINARRCVHDRGSHDASLRILHSQRRCLWVGKKIGVREAQRAVCGTINDINSRILLPN